MGRNAGASPRPRRSRELVAALAATCVWTTLATSSPAAPTTAPPVTSTSPMLRVGGDFLDEGFEVATFPPVAWSYAPGHPTNRWHRTTEAQSVRSGVAAALVRAQSSTIQDEKLVGPPLDLQSVSGTDLRLSFWWRTDPFWFQGANTFFQVHVSLDGTTWTEAFTLTGFAETGWAWRNTVIDLSSWAGVAGLVRVRFRYKGIDAADLALDDVRIGYLAPPAPPENDDCAGANAHGYVVGPAEGPFHVAGNNLLAANDYALSLPQSCTGYSHGGKDVVWKVLLPAQRQLTATMTTVGNWDDTLFVIEDCGDAEGSCVAGDRGFPDGATVALQNGTGATKTVWLVASGYANAAGEFTLDGSIGPPTGVTPSTWGRVKSAYRADER